MSTLTLSGGLSGSYDCDQDPWRPTLRQNVHPDANLESLSWSADAFHFAADFLGVDGDDDRGEETFTHPDGSGGVLVRLREDGESVDKYYFGAFDDFEDGWSPYEIEASVNVSCHVAWWEDRVHPRNLGTAGEVTCTDLGYFERIEDLDDDGFKDAVVDVDNTLDLTFSWETVEVN